MAAGSSSLSVQTSPCENLTIPGWEKLLMDDERQPLLPKPAGIPMPSFTRARKDDGHGRPLPQAIAHRGYKASFPENSMAAFVGAVAVGAHAIETDVQLSRDGVVVLSHDPTLERCFGKKEKIVECDWEYLKTLRTLAEPHEPLPRLRDLLEYLAAPGLEDVWVLLDIKRNNNLDDVMRLIAQTVAAVAPAPTRPWNRRIVLGIWAAKYLPFVSTHLPHFPLTYISFSLSCAYRFLRTVPAISFNMFAPVLVGPFGAAFRKKAHRLHRQVYGWTVNEPQMMRWAIERGLDGVVTDDPKLFLDVCDKWRAADGGGADEPTTADETWVWKGWAWAELLDLLRVQLLLFLLTPVILWWLRPWGVAKDFAKRRRSVDG